MKIRIAVAINDRGEWNACGYHKWDDKEAIDVAQQGLDEPADNEQIVFVEVDIPIPQSITVQGKVVS